MTGMGRGYEDSVQKLCWDTVIWLKGKPKTFGTSDEDYEIIREVMHKMGHTGHSGASFGCGVGHGIVIHQLGYSAWYQKMKKTRGRESEQDYDLQNMKLLPEPPEDIKIKWKL